MGSFPTQKEEEEGKVEKIYFLDLNRDLATALVVSSHMQNYTEWHGVGKIPTNIQVQ